MSLIDRLQNQLNYADQMPSVSTPSQGIQMSSGVGAGMGTINGTPNTQTQIDLVVKTVFSRTTIANTTSEQTDRVAVAPNDLPVALKNKLPVFIFGNSDYAGGFKRLVSLNQSTNWVYNNSKIVNNAAMNASFNPAFVGVVYGFGSIDVPSFAQLNGLVSFGDMIITYGYRTIGESPDESYLYTAEVLVQCPQVAYGTLLDSLSSDTFKFERIRYNVAEVDKIAQFNNAIGLFRQSMFGKLASDSINPNSQKQPTYQQANIIDIPLFLGIDKNTMMATLVNYDCQEFTWSLYIPTVTKIKA